MTQENAPRRMLVVKLSSLGDLFHALPAVHILKTQLGLEVDWVTQPEYVELVRCFTDVDRVIPFPRRSFLSGAPTFLSELRRESYDLVVDFQGLLKSAMVTFLARAGRKIGPSYSREGTRWLYTAVTGPTNKNRHAVDEALDIVQHLGLRREAPVFPAKFPVKALDAAAPRIALVPCSRWPTKNWPPERFAEVARFLRAQAGGSLFLLGAPADRPVCERIAGAVDGPVANLAGQTSLVELASVIQAMDVVVTVDSGPMHVAAALGKPVVAVFGATDSKRTGPYGAGHRVIQIQGLDCLPCFSEVCRRHDIACLHRIAVEQVVRAVLDQLGKGGGR